MEIINEIKHCSTLRCFLKPDLRQFFEMYNIQEVTTIKYQKYYIHIPRNTFLDIKYLIKKHTIGRAGAGVLWNPVRKLGAVEQSKRVDFYVGHHLKHIIQKSYKDQFLNRRGRFQWCSILEETA